jgi:hypothetical protein
VTGEPATSPELQDIHERLWRLEDFARRVTQLFAAAGGVLDAAKLIERQVFRPDPLETNRHGH